MSSFKKFLDKRAKGIAKEKALKKGEEFIEESTKIVQKTVMSHSVGFEVVEEEQPLEKETLDLSDEEFWDISNAFNHQVKISKEPIEIILQKILENYTPLKIQQFAKRYEELNQ